MKTKIRIIGAIAVAVLWLGLCAFAWVKRPEATSDSERRQLAQFPSVTGQSLLSGKFMADFEEYTLDQFPLRDGFRRVKALFHYNILGQRDNNDIIIYEDYAAVMNYPLNEDSLDYALGKFNQVYETWLKETGSKIYMAVVPDKGCYIPDEAGYLRLDYAVLAERMAQGMPYATAIDLRDCLDLQSFYRTDTHWKQEALLPVAQKISQAMGVTAPKAEDFTFTELEQPFYGVYFGQAALPMDPETITLLENEVLAGCTVTNHETGKTGGIYDLSKVEGQDLYEVYLSGPVSLLTIDNPAAATDRELIVFRDSFGSSLVPLLVQDYARVTMVDIRYINSMFLGQFMEFTGQDVLFLYSSLVLNNSSTIK